MSQKYFLHQECIAEFFSFIITPQFMNELMIFYYKITVCMQSAILCVCVCVF